MSKSAMRRSELEMEYSACQQREIACWEWLRCSLQNEPETIVHVTAVPGLIITVRMHGLTRLCGGVAVVQSGDTYFDRPEFVDNLICKWSQDAAPEMRVAAEKLRYAQEQARR